jgi:hypothetical protein
MKFILLLELVEQQVLFDASNMFKPALAEEKFNVLVQPH